ncbi:MAG TPA: alkaline phosphatase family protein [Bryobacteraceae bacterium]|nr:alkaline phosphatase family protein [Bryobacteraceae bacterium]
MRTSRQSEKSRISAVTNGVLLCLVVAGFACSFQHHAGETQVAYIGPGAGFAFLGSFLTLVAGFFLGLVSFLSWPFRMLWRLVRRRKGFRHARVHKIIFLGLDGLDPRLTEKFMSEGKLPNLQRLKEQGAYSRLRTTYPSLSPVAWSTFATGVNPAKHNIFDFLNRSLKTYVPQLSSAHVTKPRRMLRIGRWQIPLSRPGIEMRRKSQPFWKLLGEQNIGSTIIRVPITFPPDKFNGRQLSAMATPDLRGTQGSFSFFTTRLGEATYEGGSRYPLKRAGDRFEGELEGPDNTLEESAGALRIPFRIEKKAKDPVYLLRVGKESVTLQPGVYSRWIKLAFRAGPGFKISGIARFLITETEPEFSLYVSPIQIDPEKPALPVSHPSFYAAYLAKLFGTFSTLGMAEDTWALNEGVISEQNFLDQAYLLLEEREAMFRNAMEKTRRGVVACVFDTSDRIQHMFYRYLHSNGAHDGASAVAFGGTIEEMYKKMDNLVGLASSYADDKTALFVLSDHGFCSFRRGINLNSWLRDNGYLVLQDGARESGPYFRGVDWSRTKAYAVGLAGFYINLKGREAGGTVAPGDEAELLKRELIRRLANLFDDECNEVGIRTVYATSDLYKGPYAAEAPDLIVGYNDGYRTSWDAAVGQVTAHVFEDNRKAWSGDHCVDPMLVPGVFFSNRRVEADNPGIEDMAPTALSLFGLEPPRWMEGKPLRVDVG